MADKLLCRICKLVDRPDNSEICSECWELCFAQAEGFRKVTAPIPSRDYDKPRIRVRDRRKKKEAPKEVPKEEPKVSPTGKRIRKRNPHSVRVPGTKGNYIVPEEHMLRKPAFKVKVPELANKQDRNRNYQRIKYKRRIFEPDFTCVVCKEKFDLAYLFSYRAPGQKIGRDTCTDCFTVLKKEELANGLV